MRNARIAILLLSVVPATYGADGWRADPALVEKMMKAKPDRMVDESRVPKYELPDALKLADGKTVSTPEQWRTRREEILELFRSNIYGRSPGKPQELRFEVAQTDEHALEGAATFRRVIIHSRQGER